MKKYSYTPKKVESRPIYVGGRRVVVSKTVVERKPKVNKVERSLKPFSIKDLNIVTVRGGSTGTTPPPPVGLKWEEVSTTWNNTTDTWNNI